MQLTGKLLGRITSETIKLLNEQIKEEASSSYIYLAMASWCEVQGYDGSAQFLYKQSEEERTHMLKIIRYINDMGGHALSPAIPPSQPTFRSLKEVFELILKQEMGVTASIHQIVEACLKNKDYTTFEFLQWFVKEQQEEECTARKILELFDLIGEEGLGKHMIDQAIAKETG